MRRPKLFKDFKLKNDKGISNHILNGEKLNDIIIKSDFNNLDILLSGPIPPNPSDLIIKSSFKDMIASLRRKYDIVILDTPPLALVTDALSLMEYSDVNLYTVRYKYTEKKLLSYVNEISQEQRVKNLHIVFNDIEEDYGYGYGYGYGYKSDDKYTDDSNYFDNT